MKFKMSKERYDELVTELNYLQTVREKEVAEQIKEARSFGDLSENSEYDDAKSEQAKIEARIFALEALLKNTNAKRTDEDEPEQSGVSDYVKTSYMEHLYRDKDPAKKTEMGKHEAIIMYAMKQLGFYAEIAGFESVKILTDSVDPNDKFEYSGPVILTNATAAEFLSLWDIEYMNDDEEIYWEKYDPVMESGIWERYSDGSWCYPSVVETDNPNMIHCGFQSNMYVDVLINQPPKYKSDKVICFYSKGDYPQFSNFYPAKITTYTYRGKYPDEERIVDKEYASVEHYFQTMKALEFDPDGDVLKQMGNHLTCAEMKALGRKVQNFDAKVWNIRRWFHMSDAVAMKFWQNDELRELLLSTGDAILAEASPRDTFWGIGYSANNTKALDPAQWRGRNVLGNMLMDLREGIREAEQDKGTDE